MEVDMQDGRLVRSIVAIGLAAVATLVIIWAMSDAAARESLRTELGNAMIQLVVVVVLGTVLKLIVDHHQALAQRAEQKEHARQEKAEQDQHFRQEKYDRLVEVTNQLRRVPVLIEANRSVNTWSAEMAAVIDAGLQLRSLKHQIFTTRVLNFPPFTSHRELTELLETMYHYTDWVVADFMERKKQLSELQVAAENANDPEARASLQEQVWRELSELPSIEDMLKPIDVDNDPRPKIREDITSALSKSQPSGMRLAGLRLSWLTYLECESVALELMTQAALAEPEKIMAATRDETESN
jgi:hypothetical protein